MLLIMLVFVILAIVYGAATHNITYCHSAGGCVAPWSVSSVPSNTKVIYSSE